jgi:ATP-dependent 26S proteasome regulatory subunit
MKQKELATKTETLNKLNNEKTDKTKLYAKTETNINNLQYIASKIGSVHQILCDTQILVSVSGSRLVVGVRPKIDLATLKPGTRVTLD